jgi:hypothetical protein
MARLSDSTNPNKELEELTLTTPAAITAYKAAQKVGENPFEDYALPRNARKKAAELTVPGVQRHNFNLIVEATILAYAMVSGMTSKLEPELLADYSGRPVDEIRRVQRSREYYEVCTLRGINIADNTKLTGEQMLALSVMTDVSKHMTLERRLRSAGIDWATWQQWKRNPVFRAHHDQLSQQVFESAQSQIDTQVTSGALDGKLDFIKYYNELSGKHDPARRAHRDVQTILDGIVEIITRNVKDPKVLSQISAELSAVVAKLG